MIIATGIGAFSPNKLIVPGVLEFEGKGIYYSVREPLDFKGPQEFREPQEFKVKREFRELLEFRVYKVIQESKEPPEFKELLVSKGKRVSKVRRAANPAAKARRRGCSAGRVAARHRETV